MIDESRVREFLKSNGKFLHHREGQELEFKEQFNLAGLADYFRDFAAFANNQGGYLIFGVKDSPRIMVGLNETSLKQFETVDPERITGYLLEIFSPNIQWEQCTVNNAGLFFGVWRINESKVKPIIAKKDEGNNTIKNGEIYYRYAGRTQKIQFAELENIINHRIEHNNKQWIDLMKKIGQTGPQNAAILDTEKSLIQKGDSRILVIDEGLTQKLKFIKEGEFVEKGGSATLRVVGDVVPVEKLEVIKKVKEDLLKSYPYSATQVADAIKSVLPRVNRMLIWKTIADNDMKKKPAFSAYVFPSHSRKLQYERTGDPGTASSIYNQNAIDFLVKLLRDKN